MSSKKKRSRLGQIKKWLEIEFPTKHEVRLRVERMPAEHRDCHGTYHCPTVNGLPAMIRLKKKNSISTQIETLIHEWAHARTDPDASLCEKKHGGHTNEFYLEYGRIERKLMQALEAELKRK
mgnify:FL=1